MTKQLYTKLWVTCILLITLITASCADSKDNNSLNRNYCWTDETALERYTERITNTSFEVLPESGVKFAFIDEDFNFNKFKERGFYLNYWTLDETVIAETPMEAVEKGLLHLCRTFGIRSREENERQGIIVRYCSESDNWVFEWISFDVDPLNRTGSNDLITINRTSGKMVLYRVGELAHLIRW